MTKPVLRTTWASAPFAALSAPEFAPKVAPPSTLVDVVVGVLVVPPTGGTVDVMNPVVEMLAVVVDKIVASLELVDAVVVPMIVGVEVDSEVVAVVVGTTVGVLVEKETETLVVGEVLAYVVTVV